MRCRITALVTAAAFMVFSTSCTMWTTKEIQTEANYPSQNRKILTVVKTDGEVVEFTKADPGLVVGDEIRGTARMLVTERSEIEGPFPLIKRRADGTVSEVTDVKGRVHYVQIVLKEEPGKMLIQERYSARLPVSIPLSDARLITYQKTNTVLTLAAVAGLSALGLFALAMYAFTRE